MNAEISKVEQGQLTQLSDQPVGGLQRLPLP